MIIASHPDDEVLGCGGTIKKHKKEGREVYLCIGTKAYAPDWTEEYIKEKAVETKASNDFLGFDKVFFLDFDAIKLDIAGQKKLNDSIADVVSRVKPEVMYIPFRGDINTDHRMVSLACIVAARPRPGSSVKKILAYEVPGSTELGAVPFLPNYYENIEGFIEEKKQAMAFYKSELKEYPHPRSLEGIEILAKKRGMEAGLKYAEAFMLLRQIK